jgi:hypothetical protein
MGALSGGTSAESGLATVGLLLLILIGLIALGFGGYFGYTNAPVREALLDFLSKNVLYMPNILFGYGFVSDIFNNTGYHYSIASITALFGMIINRTVGGVVVGGIASGVSFVADKVNQARSSVSKAATATVSSDIELAAMPKRDPVLSPPPPDDDDDDDDDSGGIFNLTALPKDKRGGADPVVRVPAPWSSTKFCSLPGFEWLENTIAPQGIVMSMTILWYLMIELWDTGSGGQSAALGVTTAIVFIVQWLVLAKNGCLDQYRYKMYSPLIALVMAITFAGISYGIQKAIGLNSGSSSGGMGGPITGGVNTKFVCPSGTGLSPDGTTCIPLSGFGGGGEQKVPVGGKNEQSQPVNDQDQFVCEAYKDGELVTSTIVD